MLGAIIRRGIRRLPVFSPPLPSTLPLFKPTNSIPSSSHRPFSHNVSPDSAVTQSNLLITQLARNGHLTDARRLLDRTPNPDLISWTALISAYVRSGRVHDARLLFDRTDSKKNVVTWTAMLSGYVRSKRVQEAEALFDRMPEKNVISYNTMISGYINSGFIDKARNLFDRMPERNVVSWNTLLTGLAQLGFIDEAFDLFRQMNERDVISWTAMVAGLAQNGRVDDARELFNRMPKRNVVSWNAMISGYAQNDRIDEAVDLFDRMPVRDIPSWNTMITGMIQNGNLTRGQELFDEMIHRNVVTWTSLITGYVQDGQNETALRLFSEMLRDGIRPNDGTFVSVLGASSNLAALCEGEQIHQIISKSSFQISPFVNSAILSMYSKCGEIGIAWKVFELSEHKDSVSWSGMIAAYAHHGLGREAVQLFEEMQNKGFKPDDVTYVGLLSACSHSGLVDEGLNFFGSMLRNGSVKVREDHYACLVDLCGRAGRLYEAMELIDRLKIKPSSTCVWGALLSGCNNYGNVKLGNLAAEKLLEAEPNNSGTYMLLSSIYASAGKWKEAKAVRSKMKTRGLKKQPGCSWIEVGSRVHVFVAGDKSHYESKLIYSLLQDLHQKMKKNRLHISRECFGMEDGH